MTPAEGLQRSRVVITGFGVVSPIATGRADYWAALGEGRDGIGPISAFDTSACPASAGGEIKNFPAEEILGPTGFRYVEKATKFLCAAVRLAIADAGLSEGESFGGETGLIVGTSIGNLPQTTSYTQKILTRQPSKLLPMDGYDGALNSATNFASVFFKLRACVKTFSGGQSSSTGALVDAVRMVCEGRARRVVAGGVEQLSPDHLLAYGLCGLLAPNPGAVPRPYDRKREGVVLGEGSWMFVLEELEDARSRGARILAEIRGIPSFFTGQRNATSEEKQRRLRRVMEAGLRDASIDSSEVGLIVSAGNSSREDDAIEGRAIASLFGNRPLITSPKSMMGETGGASGAMQAASALFAFDRGIVPPTLHTTEIDESTQIQNLATAVTPASAAAALIDTADFASNSGCLILHRV